MPQPNHGSKTTRPDGLCSVLCAGAQVPNHPCGRIHNRTLPPPLITGETPALRRQD